MHLNPLTPGWTVYKDANNYFIQGGRAVFKRSRAQAAMREVRGSNPRWAEWIFLDTKSFFLSAYNTDFEEHLGRVKVRTLKSTWASIRENPFPIPHKPWIDWQDGKK